MIVLFALFSLRIQADFYVSTDGKDTSDCGNQSNPCASIDQIFINYPGVDLNVSVGSGTFTTNPIVLQRDAHVIIQGQQNGSTAITASWTGTFITNTALSGFEFHDLFMNISSTSGSHFSIITTQTNIASFYNIGLIYSDYNGDFVDVLGGSLVISNVTLVGASFNSYFLAAPGDDSSILVKKSKFSNLSIGSGGALFYYRGRGALNFSIEATTTNNVTADYAFIGVWSNYTNQQVTITNSIFNGTTAFLPTVYIQIESEGSVLVQNSSWTNSISNYISAGLDVLGPDNDVNNNFTFYGLIFINCTASDFVGGFMMGYTTLNISNSTFSNNTAININFGGDLIQSLDKTTFPYYVTNCFSDSVLPKASVWNIGTNTVTDLSDLLPDPSSGKALHTIHTLKLKRGDIVAPPTPDMEGEKKY